jgi:hypothetical protein
MILSFGYLILRQVLQLIILAARRERANPPRRLNRPSTITETVPELFRVR